MTVPARPSLRRETLPFRGLVLVWALLFLGVSSGLEAIGHAGCAHHGSGTGTRHTGHAALTADLADGAAAHSALHHPDDSGHDRRGACTCIGDCSAAGGVTLLAERSVHTLVGIGAAAAAPPMPYRATIRRAPTPHLLPYGQAPPLAS